MKHYRKILMGRNLTLVCGLLLLTSVALLCKTSTLYAQPKTQFGDGTGEYAELFNVLENRLADQRTVRNLGGRKRTIFVSWIRDQIHVMKAMKYLDRDLSSYLELFLERQTSEGIYYDYYYPIDSPINHRMNLFDKRYWHIFPGDSIQMHRLPVEADLEYLMVEGVYQIWQATGDTAFVRRWLSTLERGMAYAMSDPLRWSRKHQLVKRGYTLDTWDFMDLPASREAYTGDLQEAIFDIDKDTPMGIMHGDNSGMYAASRQLSDLHGVLGNEAEARAWDHQAEIFRERTNKLCWNGRYYSHFVVVDSVPSFYPEMDQEHILSLSNPYDINRGLPTGQMAQSIIRTYLELRSETSEDSFSEWYGIYPPVEPEFAGYEPGSYMNGGVNTIVAGELAKAALQHGYEEYGVDILRRVLELVRRHNGDLPVAYRPDGTVDTGIPDNWGQAAVFSALIEGLSGVVDKTSQFKTVEVTPRWIFAGKDHVELTVAYGPTGRHVHYEYDHNRTDQIVRLHISGDPEQYLIRLLLPRGSRSGKATVDGKTVETKVQRVRNSHYLHLEKLKGGTRRIEVRY